MCIRLSYWRFEAYLALGMGAFGLGAVGCATERVDAHEVVSTACLVCLTEQEKAGCKSAFSACEEVRSCDDYVLCQLMGECFRRSPGSDCEAELECEEPSDQGAERADGGEAPSPRVLAENMEECARTTCARTCGFVND